MSDENFCCAECGQVVNGAMYHPFLYCELYKLGHKHQAAYLAAYGFARADERGDVHREERT